ncbi:MAG: flagellar hook-associated protein FlgL [Erysipelotrichaceae bacterium]|nr:flagellar hook-associated protein FlgL [Erysipelotrichaceae bacterium]
MRVTNQMMTNRMLTNISRNLGLLNKYNTQGASGKKIQMPSDDPIIASRALKFRTILSENQQYMKNSEQANSWIDVTEAAVQNINSISAKMKELCQKGASDTYSTEDRKKLLTEYNSLLEQLEQELNTTYMGRYIFSGFKTDTPPIIKNQDGKNELNPEIYGQRPAPIGMTPIDGQSISLQVGAGVTMDVNTISGNLYSRVDYDDFHQLGSEADYIGSPEYEALDEAGKIEYDKELREKMSKMITTIDKYGAKVAVEHTEIGVKAKKIELIQTRLKSDETNYTDLMSENENADLGEIMMNFNTANAAYQASLRIGMNINQMTLADYLR